MLKAGLRGKEPGILRARAFLGRVRRRLRRELNQARLLGKRQVVCGACGAKAPVFAVVDGLEYGDCFACGSIAVDAAVIQAVDEGRFARTYDEAYWEMELAGARSRAACEGLARVAEAVLYTARPVEAFIDIGCGAGLLLDALARHLPSKTCFHGVEKFPPPYRTNHPNYHVGDLADLPMRFDAGVCIEVIEHLTPKMAEGLADALAAKSNEGALYLFNTGLADFVRAEDVSYLDPYNRGHIIAWGHQALRSIFEPRGFKVIPLRSWAFAVEYKSNNDVPLLQRAWESRNADVLKDPEMGEVMWLLGRESARLYA